MTTMRSSCVKSEKKYSAANQIMQFQKEGDGGKGVKGVTNTSGDSDGEEMGAKRKRGVADDVSSKAFQKPKKDNEAPRGPLPSVC